MLPLATRSWSRPLQFLLAMCICNAEAVADGVPAGVVEVPAPHPPEISGVATVPGGYAVVGDETGDHGRYWPEGGRFAIRPRLEGPESIDVVQSPDGRTHWLILDENKRTLAGGTGTRFELPKVFEEVCGRGLEGLAARWRSGRIDVAVLWEGGFLDPGSKPEVDCAAQKGTYRPPRIALLHWKPGEGAQRIDAVIDLKTPDPGDGERFRAPDLVWTHDGFLVLLSSANSDDRGFSHTWLQRFDHDGEPFGVPLKLEAAWGSYRERKNWEALDWAIDGARLVMGYDSKSGSELVIFPAPP